MSWEGYGQALCKNGHQYDIAPYDSDPDGACPFCQSKQAWVYWVDETNGCECPEETTPETKKCAAHPIQLELDQPATYKQCPTCDHRELLTQPTYKIPESPS